MCVLVIGALTGFEATAIYAEEARDPRRKVSRATFVAIGFLTVFYAAGCWLITGAFGADRAADLAGAAAGPDLTFRAAELHVGAWLADALHGLFTVSAFAATLAFHNAAAHHLYALGREGLLVPAPVLRRSGRARRGCRRSVRPAGRAHGCRERRPAGAPAGGAAHRVRGGLVDPAPRSLAVRGADHGRCGTGHVSPRRPPRACGGRRGLGPAGGAPLQTSTSSSGWALSPRPLTVAARSPPRPAFLTKANAPQP